MTTSIRFPSAGMWGRNVTLREIERTTPTTIIVGYLPPSGKLLSRMSACVWRAARRASARGLAHQARPGDCAPYLPNCRVGHQSRKSEREVLRSDFLSLSLFQCIKAQEEDLFAVLFVADHFHPVDGFAV